MTGHAPGPHLHLQLQPATAWPQQEDWFVHFAGIAFRWQDAPTPEVDLGDDGAGAGDGPTFAVEGDGADGSFAVVPPASQAPQDAAPPAPTGPSATTGPFGLLQ